MVPGSVRTMILQPLFRGELLGGHFLRLTLLLEPPPQTPTRTSARATLLLAHMNSN